VPGLEVSSVTLLPLTKFVATVLSSPVSLIFVVPSGSPGELAAEAGSSADEEGGLGRPKERAMRRCAVELSLSLTGPRGPAGRTSRRENHRYLPHQPTSHGAGSASFAGAGSYNVNPPAEVYVDDFESFPCQSSNPMLIRGCESLTSASGPGDPCRLCVVRTIVVPPVVQLLE
jgi:hypothetical protein